MSAPPDPSAVLDFDPHSRTLTGARGSVSLDPGPARLVGCMLAAPGKLLSCADLAASLQLPDTVGQAIDDVLRSHLKTVRVLAATLTGGTWQLRMRGPDMAGLVGPTRSRPAARR